MPLVIHPICAKDKKIREALAKIEAARAELAKRENEIATLEARRCDLSRQWGSPSKGGDLAPRLKALDDARVIDRELPLVHEQAALIREHIAEIEAFVQAVQAEVTRPQFEAAVKKVDAAQTALRADIRKRMRDWYHNELREIGKLAEEHNELARAAFPAEPPGLAPRVYWHWNEYLLSALHEEWGALMRDEAYTWSTPSRPVPRS